MDATPNGCRARSKPIAIAAGRLELGPSDWDAERFVEPYSADVPAFALDSHEVTEADYSACVEAGRCARAAQRGEPGLAQTQVSAIQARAYCSWRGADLPSRDQFARAAMGADTRRYPWGNTGAVCRRAAFGLDAGPCARTGVGPQLAGSHPDGATPEGIHDLAGNVAEWVYTHGGYQARGGSWRTRDAAGLRSYSYETLNAETTRDDVGFRCAHAELR
jgi:formylglycine-generating enzyme required for sulfatase activity